MTRGPVFALFGAGRIGTIHAAGIAASGRATLRYVIDPDDERAGRLAGRWSAQVASQETALRDPEVDAIVIATPTPEHVELALAGASEGKAVFCEKPLDLDLARVEACLEAMGTAGVPFAIGFQRRFDPTFRALSERVSDGSVGNVEVVRITCRDPQPPPAEYVRTSGGLFRDMMIHDFDMARWFLGEEPNEVFATGSCLVDPETAALGTIDTAVAVLRTPSGRLCQIENSRRALYGYDQRVEVFGSKGLVSAGNHVPTAVEVWSTAGVTRDKPLEFFPQRYADAYRDEIGHFIDCVTEHRAPDVGGVNARESLRLANAAQRSYDTGTLVRLGERAMR
jgi:myo-inositol 2-dehydrogenase/D-chiro-inositol 1-dehydrogenase